MNLTGPLYFPALFLLLVNEGSFFLPSPHQSKKGQDQSLLCILEELVITSLRQERLSLEMADGRETVMRKGKQIGGIKSPQSERAFIRKF